MTSVLILMYWLVIYNRSMVICLSVQTNVQLIRNMFLYKLLCSVHAEGQLVDQRIFHPKHRVLVFNFLLSNL
jgi:hypothetical protein